MAQPNTAQPAQDTSVDDLVRKIAASLGGSIEDAMARVKGVVTRRPKDPRTWPKQVIEDQVPPGYCVISDKRGRKMRKIECFHVMACGKGGYVNTLEGMGAEMTMGALYDAVAQGQTQIVQLTPYRKEREDGMTILPRGGSYPVNKVDFTYWNGTYYDPVLGRDYLERAMASHKKGVAT